MRVRVGIAATDAVAISAAVAVAHWVRFDLEPTIPVVGSRDLPYLWMSIAIAAGWWLALAISGSRSAPILGHGPQEPQLVVTASWRFFAVIALVAFASKLQLSRGYLLVALPAGIVLLLLARGMWRVWIHRQRNLGKLQANVLIVGAPDSVMELAGRFKGGHRVGFRVVGVACLPGAPCEPVDLGDEVAQMGELSDPVAQAMALGVDYIVVAGHEALSFEESRKLGWALEGTDIGLMVVPALADVAGPRVKMTPIAGLPLLSVSTPSFTGWRYVVKAMLDRVGALLGLLILLVPMLVIAVVIRLTSPGPALFVQERIGIGMKPFKMYKFRSMYVDAEARLAELMHLNEGSGALFKMKDDPRVTSIGKVLRRLSLDELPQIINVLKGEMSLVGPRPPLAREVALWEADVERRQFVKPGLTGLWQVSGRSDLSWEESVRLDLYYAENWSLGGDLVILLRTLYAVIRPRGAY